MIILLNIRVGPWMTYRSDIDERKKVLVTGARVSLGVIWLTSLWIMVIWLRSSIIFSTGRPENLLHQEGNVRVVDADITDFNAIFPHFQGQDIVFHIAALADIVPSIVNPRAYYTSNVLGTMNVVEAARLAKVQKFVYAASSSCYGIPPEGFLSHPRNSSLSVRNILTR